MKDVKQRNDHLADTAHHQNHLTFNKDDVDDAMIDSKDWVQALLDWYDRMKRDLPWRKTRDPYAIFVSELMLQQTQVSTVIPYYKRWLKRFPTFTDLARASLEEVLKAWEGLGYYRRARYLYETANIVSERYEGQLPADPNVLKHLPGIGDYTLGAILSIAFGQREPAIDGNVRRVAARLWALAEDLSKGPALKRLKETIRDAMPEERAGDFTQAFMELGATVCLPSAPLCDQCPLQVYCRAYKLGRVADFPVVKKAPPKKSEHRRMWIIEWGGSVYLRKRTEKLLEGMWEFPHSRKDDAYGSKKTIALTDDASKKTLQWEKHVLPLVMSSWDVEVDVKEVRYLGSVKHVFTHLIWEIDVYAVSLIGQGMPEGDGKENWFTPQALSQLPLPIPIQKAWQLWQQKIT